MLTPLTSEAGAEALIASRAPAWLLKHSNACPISDAALGEVEAFLAGHPGPAGLLVVQDSRPLSLWVANRLGRVHQSPQLFLVQDGVVRWIASHWSITAAAMATALAALKPAPSPAP
jgi:bacillithiol system protein YtxJ